MTNQSGSNRESGMIPEMQAQAQQAAHYQAWVQQSVDAIVSFDENGYVTFWNPAAEVILGYSAQEAKKRELLDLIIPAEQRHLYGTTIVESLEKGQGFYLGRISEVILMRKNAERFQADVSFFQTQFETTGDFTAMIRKHAYVPSILSGFSPFLPETLERHKIEELVQSLANETPCAIWFTNPEGDTIFGNRSWREFMGSSISDPIHIDWNTLIHPDDLTLLQSEYYMALARHMPFHDEFRMKRYDGQYRWVKSCANPHFLPDGGFGGYVGAFMDITDRKEAEAALQESEERFRTMAEAAPVLIGLYNAEGDSLYYNQTTLDFFEGVGAEALHGQGWMDFIHPADKEWMTSLHHDASIRQTNYTAEYRVILPDGSTHWLLRMAKPRFKPNGEYAGQICVAMDISEQKRALEKFQRISDANIIGIARWHRDGTVLEANEAFLSLIGRTQEELRDGAINWKHLTPPEYSAADEICWAQMTRDGSCPPYEKQVLRKTGERVDVVAGSADFEDKPDEGVLFVLDITRRRNVERMLQRTAQREQARRRILELTIEAADNAYQLGKPVDLSKVADEVCRFYKADRCVIISYVEALKHPETSQLIMSGQACLSADIPPITVEMAPEHILAKAHLPLNALHQINAPDPDTLENVLREKIQRMYLSPEETDAYLQALMYQMEENYGIHALLRVGIIYRGRAYGTITLHQCHQNRTWEQAEIELLQDIAQHIGNAFYQAELQRDEHLARQALEKNNNLLNIVNEAQGYYISKTEPLTLFKAMLNKLLVYTQSEFGFIGEILYDTDKKPYLKTRFISNIAWDAESRRLYAKCAKDGLEFHNLNTLFGRVLTSGQPLLSNNPETDPRRGGLPKGHPKLHSFLGLPLYKGSDMVGMIGLANRPGGYQEELIDELHPYLLSCANIVVGTRHEAIRKKLTLDLKISERSLKQYAAQLERSNQELDQFATVASHDLQAPLRKLILFSDFIRESAGENLPLDCYDYIDRMQKAVGKMQLLITDLLVLSRVTRLGKAFQPVDLRETMREVMADLEPRRGELQGTITVEGALTIDADDTQMHQVLQNLVDNALKFHKKGVPPVVHVSIATKDEQTCEIRVSDNGIGFDMQYADRVFAIFERLHGESEYEGTGIGLAIVRKIVERHQGTIKAQSKPGEGSTFIVNLPMHQAPPLGDQREEQTKEQQE